MKVVIADKSHIKYAEAICDTIDGRQGDHVLLAPPFIIEDNHISEIVDKLDQALTTTLAAL